MLERTAEETGWLYNRESASLLCTIDDQKEKGKNKLKWTDRI